MTEKIFIIHSDAYALSKHRAEGERRLAYDVARARWDDLLCHAEHPVVVGWTDDDKIPDKNGDVYDYRDGDVYGIANYIVPGENIRLCGAFREICVDAAASQAFEAGAIVSVSISDDCIPKSKSKYDN